MNQQNNTYWPASYSFYAIGGALAACLIIVAYFGTRAIHPTWIFANLVVVALFFIALNITTVRAMKLKSASFVWKLFWMALIARIVYMITIVYLAQLTTGSSFYVGAVDAIRYHRVSTEVSTLIHSGNLQSVLPHLLYEYYGLMDNIGVALVIGIIYSLFGDSVIHAKLFFNLMGAGTVVLVYKTTRLLWDESVARLAGIMMAFFPIALFYSSVILKEEFVVFLVMLGIYILTKSVKNNSIGLTDMGLLLFAMTFIFLFRTAAGALLVTLVVGMFVMNRFGGSIFVASIVAAFVFGMFIYFMDMLGELDMYVDRIVGYADFSDARVRGVARGNPLATIVGTPIFVVLSFLAPFPSMVDIQLRVAASHDATYYWVSGLIIWNFLIYFGIVGAWKAIRTKFNESLAVWGFAIGYSIILGITAMFTAVRFGYNAMPIFFILIAAGIHYRKEFPYWKVYIIGAVLLIFAWNLFRLLGRG